MDTREPPAHGDDAVTTKDEPGVEAVARALVFAAGELVTATDGEERLRPKRQAVLDAMKGTTDALLREPQHSDVRETLSDCAEFLADIDGDLARRCEAVLASLPQDKRIAVLEEALAVAIAGLGRVNVLCFDRETSPLKPVGDAARIALADICGLLGDERYDEIARAALNGGSNDQG